MITTISNRLPNQRESYAYKVSKNNEWGKSCVNALATVAHINYYNANPDKNRQSVSDFDRMLSNYRLYNNQIDQKDFDKECDPFGITPEEFRDIIQPYNKTYNKINYLIGEEWKRPFSYLALLVNSEAANEYTREKDRLHEEFIYNSLAIEIERLKKQEELNNPAPDTTGMSEMEKMQALEQHDQQIKQKVDSILSPQQIDEYLSTKWRPAAEIASDKILRILERKWNIKKQKNDGFKHLNLSGLETVYVGEVNGEPKVEILNSLKVFYHKSPEIEYIQDGMYAGYLTRMSLSEIYEKYGDDMHEDDLKILEKYYSKADSIRGDLIGKEYDNKGLNTSFEWRYMGQGTNSPVSEGSYGMSTFEDIEVLHCEWRSQRKVGFKTYIDQDGKKQMTMVDELFEIPSNAKTIRYEDKVNNKTKVKYVFEEADGIVCELEWKWIPEVWEGVRIAGRIFVNIRPKKHQFRSNENPFKVKLGYHGIVLNAMNAPNIAPMDRMRPFQFLYFIIMHKLKELIAADKAPLINIDMSMIPVKLTKEQYMHYINMGLNFYDPNQNAEGANQRSQSGQKGVYETQRSTVQHIVNYITILASIDEQIGEAVGVSRQREGQTNPQESVTGTQTAILQSSTVTELLFLSHNLLWEQVLTSLVEVAIKTWKNKEKIPYLLDDLSRGVLELRPDDFTNADVGVFITDSIKDNETFQAIRALAQPMMQNGYKISDVIGMFQHTSIEAYKREIKQLENIREQLTQQNEQAQLQSQEKINQMQIEAREDEQDHEWNMQERKYEHEKELKAMDVYKLQQDLDVDKDGVPDPIEAAQLQHDINIKQKELDQEDKRIALEAKKHADEIRERQADRKVKEKEVEVKKIAAKKKPSSTNKK